MSEAWIVKRRPRRPSAMQRHRFIEASIVAGQSAVAFPGAPMPEPAGFRERALSSGISVLLHVALGLLLVFLAHLAQEELVEEVIEISLPKPSEDTPAPRPRAIAESRGRFDPAPMALAPAIVNPTVIQPRVAPMQAQVQVADLAPVQAPREIAIQAPEVAEVRNFQSPVAATAAAPRVIAAPAAQLSGPVDFQAPAGTLAGPRQVTTGNTVGVAGPTALGTGSSVKDGIASDRDVLGAKTGERASVNTAVGEGGGRGTGGDGLGAGSGLSDAECTELPEVKAYLARMTDRVLSRWRSAPGNLPDGTYSVSLGFKLDPSGSASDVSFRGGANESVGRSAAEAMRAASPFDQMSGRTRCLAGMGLTATFKLDLVASSSN